MANEADILKALENLYGPGGVSLAGKVSGVMLSGAKAYVSLAGDPAKPEGWEAARVNAEKAIRALSGIEAAVVTLTAERRAALQQRFLALHHELVRDTVKLSTDAIEQVLAA